MEYVPVSQLRKNPNNPRIIKDAQFNKLKQSISSSKGKEFFEARPCIVSNGSKHIIAGNTRFQAAKDLGWKEVPVVYMDLTEEEEQEIIIRDNVSNGEWDWDMLANEWDQEKLEEWGLEIEHEKEDKVEEKKKFILKITCLSEEDYSNIQQEIEPIVLRYLGSKMK